jgi:hypothetical protein
MWKSLSGHNGGERTIKIESGKNSDYRRVIMGDKGRAMVT